MAKSGSKKSKKSKKSKSKSNQKPLTAFTPASISWHNLNVSSKPEREFACISRGKEPVKILKNVSGEVAAGQTLAIMGSSGAGKTTLLNVLTARNLGEFSLEGVVKINHRIADVQTIMSMSAYVQQLDLHIPILTVREHLVFQSIVRMNRGVTDEERLMRVAEVMHELSLDKCADTFVGSATTFKGISGGEMKRLSMAIEILTNPSIMFCDEPTSGLDSYMSASLIQYIDKMAETGRTIICTIHQPASEVFQLFKNLCLMADGRVAYMGKVSEAVDFFSQLGMKCPMNYNPADFYIQELAIMPGREIECRDKVHRICDYFDKMRPNAHDFKGQSSFVNTNTETQYKATCWMQYQALLWRAYLVVQREPMLTYVRLLQAITVALFVGIIYFNQKYDARGVLNMNGAMFGTIVGSTIQNSFAVVNVFCAEFPVLLREVNSGQYSVDAYFMTKNLAEIPVFVYIPILSVSIQYWMIGYKPFVDSFFYFMNVIICISFAGVSFGYLISSLFTTTDIALSVGSPILAPLQIVGGFFLNTKSISKGLAWLQYISWFHYGFDLLVVNQWRNAKHIDWVYPEENFMNQYNISLLQQIMMLGNGTKEGGAFCLNDGEQVLNYIDFGHTNDWLNFLAIILLSFGMRGIALLALYIRIKKSR